MEPQSAFLDKLPPETRLSVYSYVFGSSLVIKPSSSDTALGMKKHQPEDTVYLPGTYAHLDSSILATSKFIYNEARPILYRDKIIRGTTRDFKQLLESSDFADHARHIEIADCISTYQDADFRSILRRFQRLPRVRSLAILSDCLYLPEDGRTFTVTQFCEGADLGEATCVDIGRYQLHGKYSSFQFAHRRLVQMWPSVKSTPENYDPFDDLDSIRDKWLMRSNGELNLIPWLSQTSLRCWVGLLEETSKNIHVFNPAPRMDSNASFSLDEIRAAIVIEFEKSMCPPNTDDRDLESEAETTRNVVAISRLAPQHSHHTLSRFTELLSLNITTYMMQYKEANLLLRRCRRAYWAETDGYMPTIEFKLVHQDVARAGLPDAHYIINPVRPDVIGAIKRAEFEIFAYSDYFRGIVPCNSCHEIMRLGDLEKKQLAYLCFALTGFAPTGEPRANDEYLPDLERWAAGLLRRYIAASGHVRPLEVDMLNNASKKDLRIIVKAALSVLASEDKPEFLRLAPAMCTFAPEDFDDDLYEPFAWLYGGLLANACREHFHPMGVNLAADWRPHMATF
jgi:hypothetical protein